MRPETRLEASRKALEASGAEALLVTALSNMVYLTGFEGVLEAGAGACLLTADRARFYTDHRYDEAAREAAAGGPWEVRVQRESLYVEMCEELRGEGVRSLAMESSAPYGRFRFVSEQFVGRVEVLDGFVESMRRVKEPEEVERIERAAAIADAAFEYVLERLAPGRTEAEVALELESFMRANGSCGVAFEPIVASGPNSARPHARPCERRIQTGDFVKLDFGARAGGYCSDMTRTVVVGRADERQRELHAAVLEANEAGLAHARHGANAAVVDRTARDVLEERGMAELFTHGLGHGVGLDVHELPTLNARSRDVLTAGDVVTVEPGVYEPGVGGVRIEDLVVVEELGARVLTHSPKGLIEI